MAAQALRGRRYAAAYDRVAIPGPVSTSRAKDDERTLRCTAPRRMHMRGRWRGQEDETH